MKDFKLYAILPILFPLLFSEQGKNTETANSLCCKKKTIVKEQVVKITPKASSSKKQQVKILEASASH